MDVSDKVDPCQESIDLIVNEKHTEWPKGIHRLSTKEKMRQRIRTINLKKKMTLRDGREKKCLFGRLIFERCTDGKALSTKRISYDSFRLFLNIEKVEKKAYWTAYFYNLGVYSAKVADEKYRK